MSNTWDFSSVHPVFGDVSYEFDGSIQSLVPLSRVTITCYAPGVDGLWRPRYPFGATSGAQLVSMAAAVAAGQGALSTGVGFLGVGAATGTAMGTLTTFPQVTKFAGVGSATAFGRGSLTAGLTITTLSPLLSGTVGIAYSVTMKDSGVTGTGVWSVTSGAIPGLSLSSSGVWGGSPTASGRYTPTVQLQDAIQVSAAPSVDRQIDNEGFPSPGSQPGTAGNPALLTTTSPVLLTAGQSVLGFCTVANYGSKTVSGAHTSRALTDTEGNTYTVETFVAGVPQINGGSINQSQETDLFWCGSIKGDSASKNVWTQTYLPTSSDRDYQAALMVILSSAAGLVGSASNAQGNSAGTVGVPAGSSNSVTSGTAITVGSSQLPAYLIALSQNLSQLGKNYTPTVGSNMPGTAVSTNNYWSFINQAYPTACVAVRLITQPGSYVAYFNNPSSSQEWTQTAAAIIAGSTQTSVVATTAQQFVLNVAASTVTSGGYDGTLKVSDTSLVNGSGQTVFLRGANMSGLENSSVQGNQPWADDGGTPNWAAYATWAPNAVRIPLHSASWLGLTTYNTTGANGSPEWGAAVNNDPYGNYKAAVIAAAAAAQAIGCYVIFDLHWTAPNFTFGGVTHTLTCNNQQPSFANADHDITFWTQMAQMFGTQATPQPGVNNFGIAFELFNEPFLDSFGGTLSAGTYNQAMRNGGTSSQFPNGSQGGTNFTINQTWNIAGYQAMLNAIRATGAQNVCICNGGSYSQELQNHATYFPTDTLNPPQLVAGWHPYPAGGSTPSTESLYPKTGNDPNSGTSTAIQWAQALISSKFCPLLITEDGGCFGPQCASNNPPEPHMHYMQNFAQTGGLAGYVWWQWNNTQGSNVNGNFYGTVGTQANPTPSVGEGQQCYNWMTSFVPVVPTVSTPTFSLAAGTYTGSQSVSISTSTANATIYYTTDGTTPTTASNKYTGPITVATSETVKALATASGYTNSSVASAAYVINSSNTGAPGAVADLYLAYQGQTSWNASSFPNVAAPNTNVLVWPALSGASTFNIRRSSDNANWTVLATGLTARTYTDTTATLSVNGSIGPNSAGENFAANTWYYQVQGVSSGGSAGPWSVTQSAYYYLGTADSSGPSGVPAYLQWPGNFNAGITVTPNDTSAGPVGSQYDLLLSQNNGYLLQYTSGAFCQWNLWGGAFAYLNFQLKPLTGGTNYTMQFHCVALQTGGDEVIGPTNLNVAQYATNGVLVAGQWNKVSIPYSAMLYDSNNVIQRALYKFTLQGNGGGACTYALNWVRYAPNPITSYAN